MKPPETRFARVGDDRIAYQVLGDGPPDIVLTIGSVGPVRDLATGTDLVFRPQGSASLRGVPGEWDLFEVETLERT